MLKLTEANATSIRRESLNPRAAQGITMQSHEELYTFARQLREEASLIESEELSRPLKALRDAADQVARSFSGSWLGYHSCVYYDGLTPAPPGANFSQEWGLEDLSFTRLGSKGRWEQFDREAVKEHILRLAGHPNLESARRAAQSANKLFSEVKFEIISILETETEERKDGFIEKLKLELDALAPISMIGVAKEFSPKGQIMTRDMLAMGQGIQIPPHIEIVADVTAIGHAFGICKLAAEITTKAASHLERRSRRKRASDRVGTNVFIGHGRAGDWRILKDFIEDRLSLPWDEFNRVPAAGVTNIARLSEMLDAAAIALLVMTAEDEMAGGGAQARMNVVHEAGLFQGRLGFTRAIVLLEDGCAEFSNIQGLGQIRFPKGKIDASFEEIRRVFEREGLID